MNPIDLMDALDRIVGATTVASAVQTVEKSLAALSFDRLSYQRVLRGAASNAWVARAHVGGFPPGWRGHYDAERFHRHDPALKAALASPQTVQWSRLAEIVADQPLQARVLYDVTAFGVADGLTSPVHRGKGLAATFVAMASQPLVLSPADLSAARLISLTAAAAFDALLAARPRSDRRTLTARQIDCLRWVAEGKTSWEIGQILGISERTVTEHLDMARQKLGCRTRTQLLAEAWAMGLLR